MATRQVATLCARRSLPEQIADNARTYTEQAFKVLDRRATTIRWNSEWLSKLGFDDVIRIASMYNVGRMLDRRDFKERFESGKQMGRSSKLCAMPGPRRAAATRAGRLSNAASA